MKRIILAVTLLLTLSTYAQAQDDFQYWNQNLLKLVDTEKVDLSIYAEARKYNDGEDLGLYLVSPKLKFDLIRHISFGMNYTYIQYKKNNPVASRSEMKFQHRLELEANPYYKLTDWLKFDMRNRVEFRWIEDTDSYNTRSRHRVGFTIPVKDMGRLTKFYFNSEFFYDHDGHTYNENRTVPIGTGWKLTDNSSLNVFWLIQHKRGTTDWYANQALGTMLTYKF